MLFFVSVLLLVLCALSVSARCATAPADRCWIFIATAMLQLGSLAGLTSSLHLLTPVGWVGAQCLACAIVLPLCGGLRTLPIPRDASWWRERRVALGAFVATLSTWGATALLLILVMLALSAVTQIATPIHNNDEKMYHASRVIYWIQNQSVFPYPTHNDRQNIVPFGSELVFLWPVLLTRSELVGRIVFWLAYPCAAFGQYLLLRAMKLSANVALVGTLILITTPLVATSAIGLTPEIWSILGLLGTSYWLMAVCLGPQQTARACFLLGIFAMLSMNVRPFALLMVPGVVLVPLLTRSSVSRASRVKAVAAGLACGCLMSALVIPLGFNLARYHHPLGPAGARHIVTADISPQQIYTHAVRFAFVLLELPDVAMPAETRARVGTLTNQFISALGASAVLPLEAAGRWPGTFSYALPEQATRFSLWGMFWIPTLVIAVVLLLRNVWATWPNVRLTAVSAQALIALPVLAAILVGARWMAESDVPTRYLIGPFALTLPIGMAVVVSGIKGRKLPESLMLLVIAVSVYQPIRLQLRDAVRAFAAPLTEKEVNRGFEEALGLMPGRSRILLVGNVGAPDYPLFSPAKHYTNTVIPWGKAPFDAARMRSLIDSREVTHVLVQNDDTLVFHWDPDIPTGEMVSWLSHEPGLNEITLGTPHMRLFETGHSTEHYERPFQTVAVPSPEPLIRLGDSLHDQVGIDPVFLKTPWGLETDGTRAHLWMGQGRPEGLAFGLWARQERAVDLRFDVAAGPSRANQDRTVMLLLNGGLIGDRRFQGTANLVFPVTLHTGRNVVEFVALDGPNVSTQPNGDPRRLIVLLRDVRAESPRQPAEDSTPGGRSLAPHRDASLLPGDDLTQPAQRATAMLVSRQQRGGYWLTSYTSIMSAGHPEFEMNTYMTSLMIDVLEPVAAATGMTESVQRARQHLTEQVGAGGLVRYHGRPDAPTIGSLGCPITPDADDTALVWRVAPSAHRDLLSAALETLARYRTSDGLYRTWLAPQAQYQCLDPGSDPDPADAIIQMHVFMLLATADPAAAHALCGALQRTIDEDRTWVYYRRAPVVPLIRQIDMQRAGCEVPLPAARVRAATPDQDVWVGAARLLQRFTSPNLEPPSAVEVLDLLRRLSTNDFALLRQSPPLMYHNDLTATVPRFYWSDDFGYALWLRLYAESERHGFLRAARTDVAHADGLQ